MTYVSRSHIHKIYSFYVNNYRHKFSRNCFLSKRCSPVCPFFKNKKIIINSLDGPKDIQYWCSWGKWYTAGPGDAVSKVLFAKIQFPSDPWWRGDAVSTGPLAKICNPVSTARATHIASVLSEVPVYRDNSLPLSFRIRGIYWAWAEWLPDDDCCGPFFNI